MRRAGFQIILVVFCLGCITEDRVSTTSTIQPTVKESTTFQLTTTTSFLATSIKKIIQEGRVTTTTVPTTLVSVSSIITTNPKERGVSAPNPNPQIKETEGNEPDQFATFGQSNEITLYEYATISDNVYFIPIPNFLFIQKNESFTLRFDIKPTNDRSLFDVSILNSSQVTKCLNNFFGKADCKKGEYNWNKLNNLTTTINLTKGWGISVVSTSGRNKFNFTYTLPYLSKNASDTLNGVKPSIIIGDDTCEIKPGRTIYLVKPDISDPNLVGKRCWIIRTVPGTGALGHRR